MAPAPETEVSGGHAKLMRKGCVSAHEKHALLGVKKVGFVTGFGFPNKDSSSDVGSVL